ncbi:amino acid ABC transporter permease [Leptolyngbya sp. KIOST-1]|uniref:amino acid ABC transporter permease n=1 Tax=Leptolyngbya sp. KIOST-1 TaxID=1229172 RepID=UPI0005631B9A|nr:amino acid ABC transporter permease [Leptolyngbya sp. KIOST-1]
MTTVTPDSLSSAPPEVLALGPVAWAKKNLFSDWFNSLLTVVLVLVLGGGILSLIHWALTTAQWQVIPNNFDLLMTGTYPPALYPRIWALLAMICGLAGLSWGVLGRNLSTLFSRNILIGFAVVCAFIVIFPPTRPSTLQLLPIVALVAVSAAAGRQVGRRVRGMGNILSLLWFLSYFVAIWLIGGGLGLTPVRTNEWGGLLLTLFTAVSGIVLCFPLGLLLALGRRSALPLVRWLSTIYIELVRGVPLVALLFMGQVMIPLFLPVGSRPDRILRAIIALALFSAAYLAENVRAGLQAVPRGQHEAAASLGLNKPMTLGFIILPQALKIAIPAIVGQFISLFQDTTLLAVVGLAELLGIGRSILANPTYLGRFAEMYLFLAVIYWVFCYAMSLGSRRIEEKLNTDH